MNDMTLLSACPDRVVVKRGEARGCPTVFFNGAVRVYVDLEDIFGLWCIQTHAWKHLY